MKEIPKLMIKLLHTIKVVVQKLRFENGIISEPYTFIPSATIAEMKQL